MANPVDVVTRLILDKAGFDGGVDGAGDKLFSLSKAGAVAGAAIAGMGAVLVSGEAKLAATRDITSKLAVDLGGSAKEWENLALSIESPFFKMEDVIATFPILRKQGVETKEQMAELAVTFNALGEASEMAADAATMSGTTILKAFNIPLSEAGEHVDSLTWLVRNSLVTLPEFESFMARNGEKVRDLGLSLKETAVMMKRFSDQGITGMGINTAFNSALSAGKEVLAELSAEYAATGGNVASMEERLKELGLTSDEILSIKQQETRAYNLLGDEVDEATRRAAAMEAGQERLAFFLQRSETQLMLTKDALGLTGEEWDAYSASLDEAEGLTQKLSDAHADTVTTMDKVKHAMDRAAFKAAQFLSPVAQLGPAMMALGPAITLFSSLNFSALVPSLTAGAAAGWAFIAPWLPLIGIIAGVTLAIVGLVLLIKNWGEVSDWVRTKWEHFKDWLSVTWDKMEETVRIGMRIVLALMTGGFSELVIAVVTHWDHIEGTVKKGVEFVKEKITDAKEKVTEFVGGLIQDGKDLLVNFLTGIKDGAIAFWDWWTSLPDTVIEKIGDAKDMLVDTGSDIIQGLWDGVTKKWSDFKDWLGNAGSEIKDALKKPLEIFSPSRVMAREVGEPIGEGVVVGAERGLSGLDDVLDLRPRIAAAGQRGGGWSQAFYGDLYVTLPGANGDVVRQLENWTRRKAGRRGSLRQA